MSDAYGGSKIEVNPNTLLGARRARGQGKELLGSGWWKGHKARALEVNASDVARPVGVWLKILPPLKLQLMFLGPPIPPDVSNTK